jgi:adenosylcobinamide-phosphate synthase
VNAVAAWAGVGVDRLVGEPPNVAHPVVWFGHLMGRVEQALYNDRRVNGVVFCAAGVATGLGAGVVLRRLVGVRASPVVASAVCIAGRMLDREAQAVAEHLAAGELVAARTRVRSLVGRTPDALDEPELCRAVVESIAENGVDAVTASIVWASIGGAPAALAHRAINTLDAMVGHHNERYERFGWASARLDDLVNYVPARLTAVAAALVRPTRAGGVWRVVRRDAAQHPSPNGGVVEAAFAAALGVRLGGVNRYGTNIENRGTLGDGPPPDLSTIDHAVRLRRHATHAVAAICVLARWALAGPTAGGGFRRERVRR